MKIWLHGYELSYHDGCGLDRKGALLKCEWSPNYFGYSDLHPWPEMGDLELSEHIESLSGGVPTSLVKTSLDFNFIDSHLRRLGRNAFLGLPLPRAHRLVLDLEELTVANLETWVAEGFTHVKVKVGRNLKSETTQLRNLVGSFPLLWRLDFNGRLKLDAFITWWNSLSETLRSKIDLVEDPISMGNLPRGPWANDWKHMDSASIQIVKPARDLGGDWSHFKRVVFTHSLEHSLGMASTLWAAARFYLKNPEKSEVCGLAASDRYNEDAFSKVWRCQGPVMKPTPGTGFGFDSQLKALSWDRLR